MISPQEEQILIDRVQQGETAAYARLVKEYERFAFTIALKVLAHRPEAEEAAQDAFVKAFKHLKTFNRQSRFSTWLYRIVFNTAISYKRRNHMTLASIEYHDQAADETSASGQNDRQRYIAMALEQLNEADRVAIQLYYLREFSMEEVAEMTGQNMNTLKVRVHRARQRLGDELTKMLKTEALTL